MIQGVVLYNYTSDSAIKDFQVYGTNSSTAFANVTYSDTTGLTLLGTFSAQKFSSADSPQYFTFTNSTAYRYVVLRISNTQGTANYMGFYHVQALSGTQYSGYQLLQPGTDYAVQRQTATGLQTLYFRMLMAGTHDIIIDSF